MQDFVTLFPWMTFAVAAVLGLLVGSFLNVVILRLPQSLEQEWKAQCCELLELAPPKQHKVGLVFPASHCPKCHTPIKPWHNIPVISYLWLRGKCSSCQQAISPRYPVIELVSALLTVIVLWRLGFNTTGITVVFISWALLALTVIDIDTQLLPDNITLPLLWAGLIANSFGLITDLPSAVWGAVAGYLSLWSVFWVFKILTGKEGMGYGDFKLLAALGAWIGWQQLPLIIILSSLVGACIGIALIIIKGRDKNIPIPFGPYLAIAGWIAFLWGSELTSSYLQLTSYTH